MCEIVMTYAIDMTLGPMTAKKFTAMMEAASAANPHGWGVFNERGEVLKDAQGFSEESGLKVRERFGGSRLLVGHCRLATQGSVSDANTHPLEVGDWIVVHNGIISNDDSVRKSFSFPADPAVDSYVIAALLQHFTEKLGRDFPAVFRAALDELRGTYSILALHKPSERLFYVRRVSSFHFGLVRGKDTLLLGATSRSRLEAVYVESCYGFPIITENLYTLTPREDTLYEVSDAGLNIIASDMPSHTGYAYGSFGTFIGSRWQSHWLDRCSEPSKTSTKAADKTAKKRNRRARKRAKASPVSSAAQAAAERAAIDYARGRETFVKGVMDDFRAWLEMHYPEAEILRQTPKGVVVEGKDFISHYVSEVQGPVNWKLYRGFVPTAGIQRIVDGYYEGLDFTGCMTP